MSMKQPKNQSGIPGSFRIEMDNLCTCGCFRPVIARTGIFNHTVECDLCVGPDLIRGVIVDPVDEFGPDGFAVHGTVFCKIKTDLDQPFRKVTRGPVALEDGNPSQGSSQEYVITDLKFQKPMNLVQPYSYGVRRINC